MYCAILERNQPSLLNLALFQNAAGVQYETGCAGPEPQGPQTHSCLLYLESLAHSSTTRPHPKVPLLLP